MQGNYPDPQSAAPGYPSPGMPGYPAPGMPGYPPPVAPGYPAPSGALPAYGPATGAPVAVANPAPMWRTVPPQSLQRLGFWVDGWADTVTGRGNQVDDVARTFAVELPPHLKTNMAPQVGVIGVSGVSALARGTPSPLAPNQIGETIVAGVKAVPAIVPAIFGAMPANKRFQYQFVQVDPGFSIIVKITNVGQDLFVGWDLYAKRVWNEVIIGLILLLSLAFTGLAYFFGLANPLTLIGNPLVTVLSLIFSFLGWAALFTVIVALLGAFFRGSTAYYFNKIHDLFEYHDLTAMELVIHKTLLKSIEAIGVDTDKLRMKQQFRAGEKGRVV